VLIDLHWYEHSFGAIEVARAVKAVRPQAEVVLGGLTSSRFGPEIIDAFPQVDYVICGDAEEPLRLLAERCCHPERGPGPPVLADIPNLVYRRDGKAVQNLLSYCATQADLDSLDYVTTDWLLHRESCAAVQYSGAGEIDLHEARLRGHWLTTGRGCTFNCSYCGGCQEAHKQLAGRTTLVKRSPERVVDDIRRLADRGIHQVALSLDPAIFEPAWWQDFFRLLGEAQVRVGLYNEFFQLPPEGFVEAFAQVADPAHSEVALSPLSGDEKVRKRNGKFFSNRRLLRTLRMLKDYKIPVFVYFSLNLPGETPKAFRRTLILAEQIGRLYPSELLRMLNMCHTLDPVSPMSRKPGTFGIKAHYQTFEDYYTYCRGTGWQPRFVTRGQHRGFDMPGRSAEVIERMAQQWDAFAEQQDCRCYPVPRGW
jgi:radical SAM superfamily enzyme YgiQ (UPF0313 family)